MGVFSLWGGGPSGLPSVKRLSIKKTGLKWQRCQSPCTVGRYRQVATLPPGGAWNGGSIPPWGPECNLVSFVLSANLHRRHLSAGQQAAIVASAQDWAKAQTVGRPEKGQSVDHLATVEQRAEKAGVSRVTQMKADKVAKADPVGVQNPPAAWNTGIAGRYSPGDSKSPTDTTEEERMALQPLLKAHHFRDSDTRLTAAGLTFNTKIRHVDRESACLNLGETFDELDARLAVLALREPTRVALNPRIPSVEALRQVLRQSEKKRPPDERFSVAYGLPARYERGWRLRPEQAPDRSFVCEGQYLVLVAVAGRDPVGYIGMSANLYRNYEEREVHLTFHGELVYVRPDRRGEGYGIDLCVASCRLVRELLDATYLAAPPNWTLESTFYADYESDGGAAIAQEIHGSLEYGFDMLRECGKRKSVKLGEAELDAGF